MKKISPLLASLTLLLMIGCGQSPADNSAGINPQAAPVVEKEEATSDPMQNFGIGPIKSVELAEIDHTLAEEGKTLFNSMCSACHKPTKKYIGPAPINILERRSPEWVMNMIMNPTEMVKKDPIAKQLLADANGAIMANQNVSEEDARKILEYFRTIQEQ